MESLIQLSRKMSHALRHQPDQYSLTLDSAGWVELEVFAAALEIAVETVERIVSEDDKQRFVIRNGRIRAAQGHSIHVNLEFTAPPNPPAVLWHGTTDQAYEIIRLEGLLPMKRQYVHLSASREQAVRVGSRRKGNVVTLKIDTSSLPEELMMAENGVWLTKFIPPENISLEE